MANPMSLPVPVHHVDSGFRRKNLWKCLKRRRPRTRGEKLRNEATRSFVFSENMKKGVHVGGLLLLRSHSRQHPPSRKARVRGKQAFLSFADRPNRAVSDDDQPPALSSDQPPQDCSGSARSFVLAS